MSWVWLNIYIEINRNMKSILKTKYISVRQWKRNESEMTPNAQYSVATIMLNESVAYNSLVFV